MQPLRDRALHARAVGRDRERRRVERLLVAPVAGAHEGPRAERGDHHERAGGDDASHRERPRARDPVGRRDERDQDAARRQAEDPLREDRPDRRRDARDEEPRRAGEQQPERLERPPPPQRADEPHRPCDEHRRAGREVRIAHLRQRPDRRERVVGRELRRPDQQRDEAAEVRDAGQHAHGERLVDQAVVERRDDARVEADDAAQHAHAHPERDAERGAQQQRRRHEAAPPHRQEQEQQRRQHRESPLLREQREQERDRRCERAQQRVSLSQEQRRRRQRERRRLQLAAAHDLHHAFRQERMGDQREREQSRPRARDAAAPRERRRREPGECEQQEVPRAQRPRRDPARPRRRLDRRAGERPVEATFRLAAPEVLAEVVEDLRGRPLPALLHGEVGEVVAAERVGERSPVLGDGEPADQDQQEGEEERDAAVRGYSFDRWIRASHRRGIMP